MADIVASLFGVTPEMYQQRQAQMADEQALQYAKLDPFQQANFAIGRGAMGLAGAFAGALGAQDPQLRMISQRNAIARQIDLNNPESIMKGVQMLTEAGDTVGAMQLADEARKRESLIAQTFQRTAAGQSSLASAMRERTQATPAEILKAARVGELVTALQNPELDAAARANLEAQLASLRPASTTPATPAEIAKANRIGEITVLLRNPDLDQATRASLEAQLASLRPERTAAEAANVQLATAIEGADAAVEALKAQPPSPDRDVALRRAQTRLEALRAQLPKEAKEPRPQIQTVGVATGTNKPVYVDPLSDQQFIYETGADGKQIRKPYVGGVDRTTARVSATSTSVQENEFSKQLGSAQGKRYEAAISLRDNAVAALNTFNELSKLNDQGLISGTFATGRVGATNLLNTLGLVSADTAEKLARSENYQKVAGDAILATLGGKLGAGFSNEDRKFIQGLVPQLENSPLARRQLIDFMTAKNRAIVGETTRLIDFAENKRTLNGFVPAIPLPGTSGATTPAATGGWSIKPVTK